MKILGFVVKQRFIDSHNGCVDKFSRAHLMKP